MQSADRRPAQPVFSSSSLGSDARQFFLRIPCTCSPVAHVGDGGECSLCRGERERILTVPEASLRVDHIELLLPRERVTALRAFCLRGEWQRARSECLRIALARSDEARRLARTEPPSGPVALRSIVNTALEVAAWRALAHYCLELGDAP